MSVKNIYIIRHGETEFNKLNIVQGSGVDTDLNDTGKQQAAAFFDAYHDFPFDHIYTSALKRSQQSVKGFLEKGLPHTIIPELNEISWGDFEGKLQTVEQRMVYWQMIHKWNAGELYAKIPNGESPLDVQEKQKPAASLILSKTDEQNILICMHGRAMKIFLCLLLNIPLTRMEEFQHTNLCLYQVEYDNNICRLVKQNDIGHLASRVE
jgi:broad specificity phosphatase PhoE